MEDELDEFGIPIKKAAQNEVDEFGIPIKKKEDSTLQNTELDSEEEGTITSSDLNEVESDRPEPTFATDEQISLIKKSSGLSDEQWDDRQNQMAEISGSQKLEQTETFKKDEYSIGERSGLFDVNKKTGYTEVITENNDTKQVDIDGFDNEKMQSLTLKMRESAILSNKELQDIDAEIDRKKRGDFNLWEKIQIGAKKRISLIADAFGWESEKKRKKISSFDRQDIITSKIQAKQSDFFDSLDDEEKNQLESYLIKRNDKISKQFKEADSINNHLNKFVLPKEIKELQDINAAIKRITDKSKKELTQEDVSTYNALVESHSNKVFQLKIIDQQYKINRDTMLNSVDDILTFDRELNLVNRDYGWYKNNISPIAEGVLDIGVNAGVFVADLALNAVINNAGEEAFLMDAKKDVQDFAIWYSESRDRDRNSRKIHKTLSELNGIGDYAIYTKNLLVEQGPTLATIYATGGAGLGIVSSSSGGQRIGQLLKERKNGLNDFSDTQISGNALMFAAGEYAGESITLRILNDHKRIFRSINKSSILKRTFKENLKKAINSTYKGISTANA